MRRLTDAISNREYTKDELIELCKEQNIPRGYF